MAYPTEVVTNGKRLVLDSNILLRAVFGVRVRSLLETYEEFVSFYVPDVCFSEARKYVPFISNKRGINPDPGILLIEHLSRVVKVVDRSLYAKYEASARKRISFRDEDDWPIVATALLLDCAVWTEDRDFFGIGVPTWNTATVQLYLNESSD